VRRTRLGRAARDPAAAGREVAISPLAPATSLGVHLTAQIVSARLDDRSETPCVIYAAKSTEDRRGSIPDQLRECREAIGSDPAGEVAEDYSDEQFSAFGRSRGPGLVDAMQHVEDLAREHGKAELWAQHSDRLARGDGRLARHAFEIALWA